MGRIHIHDMADDEPVEQHPKRRQVLLYGGLGMRRLQLLNEWGDADGFDRSQIEQSAPLAPVRKSARRFVMGPPRVLVADIRCEEFPEALGGPGVTQEYGRKPGAQARKLDRGREGDMRVNRAGHTRCSLLGLDPTGT
jgi:hypothetical protein